jgi:L-malate glycosyltransferase
MNPEEIDSVAHVSFSGDFGGREKVALQLAQGMQRTNCDGFLYLVIEKRAGQARNKNLLSIVGNNCKALRLFETSSRFSFSLLRKLAKQLTADEVRIAHCHCYKSLCYLLMVRFLGFWKGCICFTLHGLILRGGIGANIIRLGQNIGIRLVDGVIGCSREVLESSVSSRLRLETEVLVNAIDTNAKSWDEIRRRKKKARAALLSRFGLMKDAVILINVGRLTPQKNFPLFLQLIEHRLLHESDDECQYLIVGNGDLHDALVVEAKSRGITDRVVFAGFVADMETLYLGADMLVQTSLWEGTPMCLLEARSYGLPAIVPDVGGNSDVLTSGKDGFLFRTCELLQLANYLKIYLENRDLLEMHGRCAFKDTKTRFGVDRWVEQHLKFYTKLQHNHAGRS